MTEVVSNFLRRSGVIVNEDAAIACAILGQPTKVATNAGLALAREALKAQRDAIVAMEKRAAEAAASHGTNASSAGRDARSDPNNEIRRLDHAAPGNESQNRAPAPSDDPKSYGAFSILV